MAAGEKHISLETYWTVEAKFLCQPVLSAAEIA